MPGSYRYWRNWWAAEDENCWKWELGCSAPGRIAVRAVVVVAAAAAEIVAAAGGFSRTML